MALVGSGNVPDYPGAIDQAETRSDGDVITANFQNDIQNGWVIIQQTLGVNPQGTFGSVAARLDAVTILSAGGLETIPAGADNVVVSHGLSETPDDWNISLTARGEPTNDIGILFFDQVTATTFRIRVQNAPGGAGLPVVWQILRPSATAPS